MSSTPVNSARVGHLNKLGEEYVFDAYLRIGSVRKLCWEMFEAREEGQKPGVRAFYMWLDQEPGRRDRWQRVLEMRGDAEFDEIGELADEIDETNVRSHREKIKAKQWRAERLHRSAYGKQTKHTHEHTVGEEWLEAMKEAEQERIPEAEAQIIEAEDVEDEDEEVEEAA